MEDDRMKNKFKRTKNEEKVLVHLEKAVKAWSKLEHQHPMANDEFVRGIHICQYLIGMRQIARIDNRWSPR